MRQQEPFSDTGTTWLFDYKHYAVIEKRIDGTDIVHVRLTCSPLISTPRC